MALADAGTNYNLSGVEERATPEFLSPPPGDLLPFLARIRDTGLPAPIPLKYVSVLLFL